jgi:hypothetical protein
MGIRDLMTKIVKFYSGKNPFGSKNCNTFILRPPCRTQSKLQEKPLALKREQPTLQNMKFHSLFLLLWENFALLDPDPAEQNQCGSGSTTLVKMGS